MHPLHDHIRLQQLIMSFPRRRTHDRTIVSGPKHHRRRQRQPNGQLRDQPVFAQPRYRHSLTHGSTGSPLVHKLAELNTLNKAWIATGKASPRDHSYANTNITPNNASGTRPANVP